MTRKLETITEILEKEKQLQERKETQRKVILKKKEQAEKIRSEKAKKWAMLRWINEYIEENQGSGRFSKKKKVENRAI